MFSSLKLSFTFVVLLLINICSCQISFQEDDGNANRAPVSHVSSRIYCSRLHIFTSRCLPQVNGIKFKPDIFSFQFMLYLHGTLLLIILQLQLTGLE